MRLRTSFCIAKRTHHLNSSNTSISSYHIISHISPIPHLPHLPLPYLNLPHLLLPHSSGSNSAAQSLPAQSLPRVVSTIIMNAATLCTRQHTIRSHHCPGDKILRCLRVMRESQESQQNACLHSPAQSRHHHSFMHGGKVCTCAYMKQARKGCDVFQRLKRLMPCVVVGRHH